MKRTHRNTVTNVRYNDNGSYTYDVENVHMNTGEQHNFPESCSSTTCDDEDSEDSPEEYQCDVKNKVGRPSVNKKRYTREPTMYNKFIQNELKEMEESNDVSSDSRMAIAAKKWKRNQEQ